MVCQESWSLDGACRFKNLCHLLSVLLFLFRSVVDSEVKELFSKNFLKLLRPLALIIRGSQGPGEAKVADFDGARTVDKQVCRLQIPMDDVGRVKELNGAEHVVQYCDDVLLVKAGALLHRSKDFLGIALNQIHYKEDVGQVIAFMVIAYFTESFAVKFLTQKFACLHLFFLGRLHVINRSGVELWAVVMVRVGLGYDNIIELGCE